MVDNLKDGMGPNPFSGISGIFSSLLPEELKVEQELHNIKKYASSPEAFSFAKYIYDTFWYSLKSSEKEEELNQRVENLKNYLSKLGCNVDIFKEDSDLHADDNVLDFIESSTIAKADAISAFQYEYGKAMHRQEERVRRELSNNESSTEQ